MENARGAQRGHFAPDGRGRPLLRDATVFQTPVGFKYIGELIQQDKIAMGGEESAGMTIRGHVPEKDGILACLLVAEMVAVAPRFARGTVARAVQARGRRILAAAHESPLARGREIENGGPAESRFFDVSRTARQADWTAPTA